MSSNVSAVNVSGGSGSSGGSGGSGVWSLTRENTSLMRSIMGELDDLFTARAVARAARNSSQRPSATAAAIADARIHRSAAADGAVVVAADAAQRLRVDAADLPSVALAAVPLLSDDVAQLMDAR